MTGFLIWVLLEQLWILGLASMLVLALWWVVYTMHQTSLACDRLTPTLPKGCVTLGDLVRIAVLRDDPTKPMDADVLKRVITIVSEQMGVPVRELSPATRFVEDLDI